MTIKARSGPVRDVFLDGINRAMGSVRKLHPTMSREAMLGGLDFAQTLASGKIVTSNGLLEQSGTILLTMAERCHPDMAALIASALDTNPDLNLILLDEGAEQDETAPKVISERLAFHISLDDIGRLEAKPVQTNPMAAKVSHAAREPNQRHRLKTVIQDMTVAALRLGISSMRAPLLAVQAARLHAQLQGRSVPDPADMKVAVELVLAPRATQMPETEPSQPEAPQNKLERQRNTPNDTIPDSILIDAVHAVLPANLLETLNVSDISRAKGSGAGQRKRGNRRGRPLPSRPGSLDGTSRLDLVATLRAAAPWQTLRGKTSGGPVCVHPSDIYLKRYEDRSDRLIVFAVDASGSAALARLGEAKGAVELLLARAYASRDHVALIAFRGEDAQLLLPPTRSLVQTKRRLAELPGGGGTPLASGLQTAADLAQRNNAQGLSPLIAVLTDGRANIALDGTANRKQAGEDAHRMARWINAISVPAVVLDVGKRPHPMLASLAKDMGARYMAMPRGTAETLSNTLGAAMDHGLGT